MYDKIYNFKFLPPGRGLWSMGTSITETKKIYTALNNCAFISTKPKFESDIEEIIKPYLFLMDNAMLGVGVGYDTNASHLNFRIKGVLKDKSFNFSVKDSREGWVESLNILLKAHFLGLEKPIFDYSKIRPAGSPLKIFGGVSGGPEPLIDLHRSLGDRLEQNAGKLLDSRLIVDIMNLIGRTVVAGNISKQKFYFYFNFKIFANFFFNIRLKFSLNIMNSRFFKNK